MDNAVERRLAAYRYGLWFMLGVTTALAVTFIAGNVPKETAFLNGWAVLWLVSIIGCPPLGVVMLIGPVWRTLPLAARRRTAIGYLTVGLLDLLILAVGLSLALGPLGPGLWLLASVYALGVVAAIVATQPARRRAGEDLFP